MPADFRVHAKARPLSDLKTRRRHERIGINPSRGFTLVERLIVIAVIVILIALLMPAIGAVRARARQAQCASNQRQIWVAWTRANARDPSHPVVATQWTQRVATYVAAASGIFYCP